MSVRQALLSFLHLFVLFVFFSVGLFFLALPKLPKLHLYIEHLLLQNPSASSLLGMGFSLAGLLLLAGFYGLSRGRYLRFRMGKNQTEIEASVVLQTLEEFLKARFSKEVQLLDVELIRSKIHIKVSLIDPLPEEILTRVEKELTPFLRQRFGYTSPFDLIVKM